LGACGAFWRGCRAGRRWFTGQFYALFFLEKALKVDGETTRILFAIGFSLAVPFMVFFGWLSDRIGGSRSSSADAHSQRSPIFRFSVR